MHTADVCCALRKAELFLRFYTPSSQVVCGKHFDDWIRALAGLWGIRTFCSIKSYVLSYNDKLFLYQGCFYFYGEEINFEAFFFSVWGNLQIIWYPFKENPCVQCVANGRRLAQMALIYVVVISLIHRVIITTLMRNTSGRKEILLYTMPMELKDQVKILHNNPNIVKNVVTFW